METAGAIVAIIGTVIIVAGFAQRLRVAAPLVLLVVGVAVSYVPFIPEPELSSEVVLVGLLPPLLYAAAIRTSLVDFRANWAPILGLSVGLVLFTAAGVGLVTYWLLGVPFAVAFALGAIVAPPDAVAATAVARRIGLPRRIVTILEGESLVNDATALVSLRTAIAAFPLAAAAVTSEHASDVTMGSVALDFTRAVVLGVGFGVLVGVVIAYVRRKVTESAIDTSISFIVPYLAYLPAERFARLGRARRGRRGAAPRPQVTHRAERVVAGQRADQLDARSSSSSRTSSSSCSACRCGGWSTTRTRPARAGARSWRPAWPCWRP